LVGATPQTITPLLQIIKKALRIVIVTRTKLRRPFYANQTIAQEYL
jgi:hypothetical protein